MYVECSYQPNKDHKLLSQMDFDDNQQLNVRIVSALSISSFSTTQVRTGLSYFYCMTPLHTAQYILQKFCLSVHRI